jgi:hypothetical protein
MTPKLKELLDAHLEIKKYHELRTLYYSSAKLTSEFDVKLYYKLSDKLEPIDIIKVLLDQHEKLAECCRIMSEALEKYRTDERTTSDVAKKAKKEIEKVLSEN